MDYADTSTGQRVVVVGNRNYPNRFVGREGTIMERYDGIDSESGTVEVKLDDEYYAPPIPGWMQYTHMGCEQLVPA